MSNSSRPTYIYKLVPSSSPVPDELPERLPVSDIDKNSGFIHLSTAPQVPGTLKFFFADDPKVHVLRLRYDALESQIRWEDPKGEVCGPRGGEGMFPVSTTQGPYIELVVLRVWSVQSAYGVATLPFGQHLYNGLELGKEEVESVLVLERGQGGAEAGLGRGWDEALKKAEAWLVY